MGFVPKLATVFAMVAALLGVSAAAQQSDRSLEEAIGDLLRGMEQPADGNGAPKPYTPPRSAQPQAPAPGPAAEASRPSLEDGLQPRRRIPFGREEMQLSFAPLVKRTAPAVVNVYAAREVRQRSPFAGDPFFEQFFGREFNMPPRMQSSLGSGVIVRGDGIVVTNNHVIEGADAVKVALADGREFESKILLKDKRIDLAILKIENGQAFPVLPIGDSDSLEIGDLVLAIGNPFGVGQTTTTGIVSAVARTSIGVSDFGFFIQTDAAINPGNSGGALIDMGGRLIGINTAIFSRSGGSIGIGFAIPANIVAAMLRTVERGGDVFERPWIGAEFDAVSPEIAESLGMDRPTGAIVVDIEKGGPADKAGIRPGDVVVRIDEHPVEHPDALGYRLSTLSFGDTVNIEVMRQGRRANMPVQVVAPPGEQRAVAVPIEGRSPFAGARVANISRRLSREFDLPQDAEGVVIVEVEDGSPAARVGFRPGDVVMALGRQKVRDAEQLRALAQEDGNWWRFTLNRGGRIINQVLRY